MASPATVSHCHHSPATAGDVSSTSLWIYVVKCHAVTVLMWEGHNLRRDYQLGGWGVQIQNTFPRLSRWQKQHGKRPIALGGGVGGSLSQATQTVVQKILIIIIYIVYVNVSHYLFICYFFKKCKNLKK